MKKHPFVLTRRAIIVASCAALLLLSATAGKFMSRGQTAALGYALIDPSLAVPVTVEPDDEHSTEQKIANPSAPAASVVSPAKEDLSPSASASESMFIPPVAIYQGQPDNGNWIWPMHSRIVTSPFGVRSDPFSGAASFHSGVDISGGCGAEIWASREGTVTFAGVAGGYGNRVVIDHGNGISSTYSHLHTILVKPGQAVQQRQTIGQEGTTGRSTGCHLHYEIMVGGKFADPLPFLTGQPSTASTHLPQPSTSNAPGHPSGAPANCAVALNAADAGSFGGSVPIGAPDICIPLPASAAPSPSDSQTPAAQDTATGSAVSSAPIAAPEAAAPAAQAPVVAQPATAAQEPGPAHPPQPQPQPVSEPKPSASTATPTPTPSATPSGR